jgi:hypothetical protein
MLPIRIRPEAHKELVDACAWYETARPGLGAALNACVSERIASIQKNPLAFRLVSKRVRCATVRRFRYQIFYEVFENYIEVYSVFHTSRDPKVWRRRIKKK